MADLKDNLKSPPIDVKEQDVAKSSSTRKEPPPEKPSDIRRRTFVVISFWVIIVFLGLPIWWKTTAIYRAHLPLSSMMDWADGRVRSPVSRLWWKASTNSAAPGLPTSLPAADIHQRE